MKLFDDVYLVMCDLTMWIKCIIWLCFI